MMARVAAAALLLPLVLAAIVYLPGVPFLCFLSLPLSLAIHEYRHLMERSGLDSSWLLWPLSLPLPWIWIYRPQAVLPFLILASLCCSGWSLIRNRDPKIAFFSASGNFTGALLLGLPFCVAAQLQGHPPELMLVLGILWISDAGAFLIGRTWGRHKITPRLSPGKTLEGYLAGLLCAGAGGVLLGSLLLSHRPTPVLALSGLTLGALGIGGDLFESLVKRAAGVKDSSALIPGHGGILDRIDSLLFALPGYYLLVPLVQ